MVFNTSSSFILVDQKRSLFEVFSDSVRKQSGKWELRGLVLFSLALQILLMCSGKKRKYIVRRRIRIFIWSAYLLSDWIARVTLGLILDRQGNMRNSGNSSKEYGDLRLMAFWAPFLLLHLGGPDTITAYVLADNDLWLRNFVGFLAQTGSAMYIALLSWEDTLVSYLTIPIILCGMVKCGERTWVLMSASREQFLYSVLADRDPGPSYAKFMADLGLKEAEGYYVSATQVNKDESYDDDLENAPVVQSIPDPRQGGILKAADYFFETLNFKRLFVDLILSFQAQDGSQGFFEEHGSNIAFEVIEVELGFAYDIFYSKTPTIYTLFGLIFRVMTFLITLSVMLIFVVSVVVEGSHNHLFVDVVITCVLLVSAILLEVYAARSSLLSDWANLWFCRHSSKFPFIPCLVSSLQSAQKRKRWSNSMYQFSLLDFCLNKQATIVHQILRCNPRHKMLNNLQEKWGSFRQLKHSQVTPELKTFIYNHMKKKSTKALLEDLDHKDLLTCRGGISLKAHKFYGKFKWAIVDVEFDQSILMWHIATDLCYDAEKSKRDKDSDSNEDKPEWYNDMLYSKELADYMLYILVDCPFMLPMGIGLIRFQDTCAEAQIFFQERRSASKVEAYDMLRQVSTKVFPSKVKGDRSKSVLFEACKLAASLIAIDDGEEMWKMMGDVWVEMLGYAASQCRGFDHAQQLHKGGELLTHIWLLMAHLGLTDHFKILEGHARVKLAVT